MTESFARWEAERFRQQAEELRTIAETMLDPQSRTIYQSLAVDYERMAEHAEKLVPT